MQITGTELHIRIHPLCASPNSASASATTSTSPSTPSYLHNAATLAATALATVESKHDLQSANVTSYIRGLIDNADPGGGMLGFRGDEPVAGSASTLKKFQSALSITYTQRPPAPALTTPVDGKLFATTTPTLNIGSVTDPDGDQVTYAFQISTAPGSTGQVINSGWISGTSWQVPAGVLRDGVTYYWTAFALDASSVAAVSLPGEQRSFSVDLLLGGGKNTPSDSFGPVSVNLVTGNVSTSVSTPEMSTVGGGISVGFTYNSQTPLAGGLDAKYYTDANSDRSYAGDPVVLARRDSTVFFDWSTGSPGYSVPSDSFIVRWDGYVTVPAAGDYKFGAISDDGARIWVGDTAAPTPNMLDDWNDHAVPTTPLLSATAVNFAAGSLTKRIRIEYYDATQAAR